MTSLGIYVHIPFCHGKCAYCDFVSGVYSEEKQRDYFSALKREIASFDFSGYFVDTIYCGGGTPSSVDAGEIADVLSILRSSCGFTPDCEISLECNPESLTADKCAIYVGSGINRLSIGLQCATDNLLASIGRLHNTRDFIRAHGIAEKYFDNISADIMLGLPGQTEADVRRAVDLLAVRKLEHVSAYALKVEAGTPLAASGFVADEDCSAGLYDLTCDMLLGYGYRRYEVSNFSFPGKECRHNLRYWKRKEYAGFGVAAHSFIKNKRSENTCRIDDYIDGVKQVASSYIDPAGKEAADESLMLALRTADGLDLSEYKEAFGIDLLKEKNAELNFLENYVTVYDGRLKLTDKGYYVMNEIIVRLTD